MNLYGYKDHTLLSATPPTEVPVNSLVNLVKHMLDNNIQGTPVLLNPVRAVPEQRLVAAYRALGNRESRLYEKWYNNQKETKPCQ